MASTVAATLLRRGGRQFFLSGFSATHHFAPPTIRAAQPTGRKSYHSSGALLSSSSGVTNGKFMSYAMLYHDSVAFLLSNQLGIPVFMANESKTPTDVANEFNLSVRAASALLVTLCRMDVVEIAKDSDYSVDDIVYRLTPSAKTFLADRNELACVSPFVDTFTTNFISPDALLESSLPADEKKDIMSEHLEQDDETVANNARHFMAHMNAQSYCCAKALPQALDLESVNKPKTLLDVGGGSAIYTIEAIQSNPNMKGIVFELPAIKPITQEYIDKAKLTDRVSVSTGDFFKDPLPDSVDYVLFSNIFHDWPDEINMNLIQKAYDSLNPGGKIVVSELLLADDVVSSTPAATSMNVIMLPYTKGRQYRPKELFCRLEKVGFTDPEVINLVDDYDLVIGTKP
ncbi:hypothetical protein ACHAWT_006354 [Skeletonema menzelii]